MRVGNSIHKCVPKIHSQILAAVVLYARSAHQTHTHTNKHKHKYSHTHMNKRVVCVFLEFSLRILFSHLPQRHILPIHNYTNGDRLRQHLPIFKHVPKHMCEFTFFASYTAVVCRECAVCMCMLMLFLLYLLLSFNSSLHSISSLLCIRHF